MDKKVLLFLVIFITATCAEPFIWDILYELFESSEESWDNKNVTIQCKNCSITVNGQTMGSEMTAPPNAPTTPTNAPTTTIASMQTAPVTMPPMATNPMTMPPMTAMTEPPTEETNRG